MVIVPQEKTTLSKTICEKEKKYGFVNMISTDDFIVNTELRNNANANWNDNGNDYYYLPKKEDVRLLKANNFITIIEG